MSYELLALMLALATYGLASTLCAALVAVTWALMGRSPGLTGAPAARLLFALRLFPSTAATLLVALFVLPAYWKHEPWGGNEQAGPVLLALAGLGALPWLLGLAGGWRDLTATRGRTAPWRTGAQPLRIPGVPLRAFRVRDRFPVVSVAGLLRPRLYLADQVLKTLTPAELSAVCAHERAHVQARDNLKALLLRSCPDWLAWLAVGRELEDAWLEAAEQAADDQAVEGDRARAVCLASAIVKTARLVPAGARLGDQPASALHGGSLSGRVERLLTDPLAMRASIAAACLLGTSALTLLAGLATLPALLPGIHRVLEGLVHLAA